ncbi:MAG: hypothetical protein ACWGQW_07525 [bacterium]
MAWINDDGLQVKFGTEEVEVAAGGFQKSFDGNRVHVKFYILAEELEAFGTTTFLSDTTSMPNGAILESATLNVIEAFVSAGTSGTLALGTYDTDHTTAHDADGIDTAIAEASLTAGASNTCNGALIGTTISNSTPVLFTALVGTEDFTTSGAAELDIVYYVPRTATLS